MAKHLILGGARSGKSVYAEKLAEQFNTSNNSQLVYIATATVGDDEMAQRVAHHQQRRSDDWQTIEEPLQLAKVINDHASDNNCILVDCLTLWMTNLLNLEEKERRQHVDGFLSSVSNFPGELLLVSNEVGMGIVPMGELTRLFCDETGRLHQQLGQVCEQVTLMVAGIPMIVKGK